MILIKNKPQVLHLSLFLRKISFQETENNPNKEQVSAFVDNNFDPLPNDDNPQGSEFEDWDPSDWNEDIPLFNLITVNTKYFLNKIILSYFFLFLQYLPNAH